MAFLEFISGTHGHQTFELSGRDTILGRGSGCAIHLNSPTISKRHAVLRNMNGTYVLQDLRSRNGTRHNGKKLATNELVTLRAGDQLQISDHFFIFHPGDPQRVGHQGSDCGSNDASETGYNHGAATGERRSAGEDKAHPSSMHIAELDTDTESGIARAGEDAEAKLHTILQLGNRIGKLVKLETLLPDMLDGLFGIFPKAAFGFVWLKQYETTKLVARSTHDCREFRCESLFDQQIAEQVMASGKAALHNNESEDADRQHKIPVWSSRMCVPLRSETGDTQGVVQLVIADSIEAFFPRDLDVLNTVASLTSLAIENSSLHQQVIEQERLRALGQMACGAAHDLNNALSPVLGYADLILHQPDLPENVRDWTAWIYTGAKDAATIVEQLQYFYRPMHLNEDSKLIKLDELVKQMPQLTRPRWCDEARRDGHRIELALELMAAPAVHGVESELRQVLTNLVFNAIESIPNGGQITLRLDATYNDAIIEVTDTGCGMTEAQQNRCFEPFFTTRSTGSGLGLGVCLAIVKRHAGRIEITSVPQQGTTVRIVLPRTDQSVSSVSSVSNSADTHLTADLLPANRVLYIDDDRRLRSVVRSLLEKLGQRVEVVEDGAAGLARLKSGQYDVVITDLGMSGIDGHELIRQMRQLNLQTPVLLLTGWSAMDAIKGTSDLKFPIRYIAKPPTLQKLHSALLGLGVTPFKSPPIAAKMQS